jgi:RNA ligase
MNLLNTLEQYYNDGWLIKQTHPELPLTIWNYSQTTQYAGKWDGVTTVCRGLVTDNETGEIVGRPFKKFFNQDENKHTPTKDFDVFAKEDGSLIIAFQYKGNWVISSRGSFTSEQAIAAEKLFYELGYHEKFFNPKYTHLFEYCSDWNRIVVKYDKERLILLGMVDTKTGEDVDVQILASNLAQKELGFIDVVKKYDGITDYTKLKEMIGDNEEGFVIRFSNGERIKIKGEEYIRLHRIMTNVSTTSVWEILANGGNMEEVLKDVPDEFYDKIKEFVKDLAIRFDNIRKDYLQYFTDIIFKVGTEDRKSFAEEANRYNHPSILFALLNKKDINPIIWKIVKPEWRKL